MFNHSGNRAVPRFSANPTSHSGSGSDQRRLRRRTIRKTCQVKVEFAVGFSSGGEMQMDTHTTKGKLLDLSSGGACVLIKYEITPGQDVTLHIDLQERAEISPHAQVRWTKPIPEKKGHACGLQFRHLSDEDQRRLRWFLDELDQQTGGGGSP
jgi:c-di-GMP-binding flagellar brake protein YcgR